MYIAHHLCMYTLIMMGPRDTYNEKTAKRNVDGHSKRYRNKRSGEIKHTQTHALPAEGDYLVNVGEHGIDVGTGNRASCFSRSGGILLLLEPA